MNDDEDEYVVDEVKLVSVTFVPTWHVKGENSKHTVIGQAWIEAGVLSQDMQKKLKKMIKAAYLEHLLEQKALREKREKKRHGSGQET